MPRVCQRTHARRRQPDTIFVVFDFLRKSDEHLFVPPRLILSGVIKRGRKASPDPDLRLLGPNRDQVSLLITTHVAARRLHLLKIYFVILRALQLTAVVNVD